MDIFEKDEIEINGATRLMINKLSKTLNGIAEADVLLDAFDDTRVIQFSATFAAYMLVRISQSELYGELLGEDFRNIMATMKPDSCEVEEMLLTMWRDD